jgi:hypothetical protein
MAWCLAIKRSGADFNQMRNVWQEQEIGISFKNVVTWLSCDIHWLGVAKKFNIVATTQVQKQKK